MEDERLIEEVYKYKFIYDKSDAKHSNKDYIGKAWADIAKELNCNVDEAKKRWGNLRDYFRRLVKEQGDKRSGDGASKKKHCLPMVRTLSGEEKLEFRISVQQLLLQAVRRRSTAARGHGERESQYSSTSRYYQDYMTYASGKDTGDDELDLSLDSSVDDDTEARSNPSDEASAETEFVWSDKLQYVEVELFTAQTGPNLGELELVHISEPYEFFKLYFSDNLVIRIREQTNLYAQQKDAPHAQSFNPVTD
ncbi:hypothetical protein RRG08_012183 [Elysia crispata]|uniref:MADF domain-containing protein n=1 Tax=Elysia crispata TaxID=231223 RepID=A0AAE0ZL35_9GAST|nr:hypothetical protein RRG08_012183 [Elysia crispata]